MLGWQISIYRQADDGRAPATVASPAGTRIAVWQTDVHGLDWIENLVKDGAAIDLGGDGYPCRYTATAVHLVPVILAGPPDARATWLYGKDDVITERWSGTTVIDPGAASGCRPDEWLLVEAWDGS